MYQTSLLEKFIATLNAQSVAVGCRLAAFNATALAPVRIRVFRVRLVAKGLVKVSSPSFTFYVLTWYINIFQLLINILSSS